MTDDQRASNDPAASDLPPASTPVSAMAEPAGSEKSERGGNSEVGSEFMPGAVAAPPAPAPGDAPEPFVDLASRPVPRASDSARRAVADGDGPLPQAGSGGAGTPAGPASGDGAASPPEGRSNSLIVWQPAGAEGETAGFAADAARQGDFGRTAVLAAGLAVAGVLAGIAAALLLWRAPADTGIEAASTVSAGKPALVRAAELGVTSQAGIVKEPPAPAHPAATPDAIRRLTETVAALETRVATLGVELAESKENKPAGTPAGADNAAVAAALARLTERLDRLDQQMKTVEADIQAKPADGRSADKAAEVRAAGTKAAGTKAAGIKAAGAGADDSRTVLNPSAPGAVSAKASAQVAASAQAKTAAPRQMASVEPQPREPAVASPRAGDPRAGDPRALAELRPPAAIPDPRLRPARGWVLRDLYNGIALIEGRGGMLEVVPGQYVPGLGRVETIERRGRQWVVVTERGYIPALAY